MAQTHKELASKRINILTTYVGYTFQKGQGSRSYEPYLCNQKQTTLLVCKICEATKSKNPYTYACKLCRNHFCVAHFIDHCLLFGYCQKNKVIATCKSTEVKIDSKEIVMAEMTTRNKFYQVAIHLANPS